MGKQLSSSYTDTPISGVSSLMLPLNIVNFPVDFRIASNGATEAVLTNLTCPTDRPEKFRFSVNDLTDIYKGSNIDSTLYTPSKRGTNIFIQLTDVMHLTDTADSTYEAAIPISGSITLKIPNNELLTSDMVKNFIGRLADGFFNSGLATTERISALARGSLIPDNVK